MHLPAATVWVCLPPFDVARRGRGRLKPLFDAANERRWMPSAYHFFSSRGRRSPQPAVRI